MNYYLYDEGRKGGLSVKSKSFNTFVIFLKAEMERKKVPSSNFLIHFTKRSIYVVVVVVATAFKKVLPIFLTKNKNAVDEKTQCNNII